MLIGVPIHQLSNPLGERALADEVVACRPSGLFEEEVAVVPGTAFGESGAGHIRCSYATSVEKIQTALERIERFVKKVSPAPAAKSKADMRIAERR